MFATSDDIHAYAFQALSTSLTRPAKLNLQDHPDLPVAPTQWPVCALYVIEGDKLKEDGGQGADTRETTLRVELRVDPGELGVIQATQALRTWVLRTLLSDPSLGGLAFPDGNLDHWEPYGDALDARMAGAVLDFTFTHYWKIP